MRIRTNKGVRIVEDPIIGKEQSLYIQELRDIKGIGDKTVMDIIGVFPTYSDLLKAESMPLRDDIVKKLKEYINNG